MNYPDIIDYLNGHSDPVQQQQLERWIAESAENAATFRRIQKVWEAAGGSQQIPEPDIEQAWKTVSSRALQRGRLRSLPVLWRRIAAAILLLIIGYSSYIIAQQPKQLTFSSEGREIPAKVELPDGTMVYLNKATKISYPRTFSGKTRPVTLEGEAYFEVQRIEDQPFTISAGETMVKVLGTTFNVRAYPDRPITDVAVTSGRVAFYAVGAEEKQVVLEANESAIYRKDERQILSRKSLDRNHLAWKEQRLRVEDQPLGELIETLEASLDIDIQLSDPKAEQCIVTADLSLDSTQNTIQMLVYIFNFELETPDERTYVLKGAGCE